jgi:chromosome partitioning protein
VSKWYHFDTKTTPLRSQNDTMIVLIGSQKGGCGKSTIATNLCVFLASRGKDVMLVDSDRQSTSSRWISDRSELDGATTVHSIQKYDNIRDTLIDFNARYDFVIIDTSGRDSRELRTGMTIADLLLIPFRPSQPDLDTLPHLQDIIIQAQDLNPNLTAYGLLTMAPTNPVVNEIHEAKEYLKEYQNIHLVNSIIRDRKVYRDAISEGLGVIEMSNQKAKFEMEQLAIEVLKWSE